jgi:hypothetical protein
VDQLALSGVRFVNNLAEVASVLFTEAAIFEPLNCTPVECEYNNTAHNNTARGSRALTATPPTHIAVNMSATMRSGAQLPLTLRLVDGCVRVVLCLRFNATLVRRVCPDSLLGFILRCAKPAGFSRCSVTGPTRRRRWKPRRR